MGKLIDEPIQLKQLPTLFEQTEVPTHLTWRGKDYRIEAIGGEWRTLGRWWEGEGERRYVRAITTTGLAMDLCHDAKTGSWMLHELQD